MSYTLWKYFLEDDVDSFRQYVARATFDRNASKAVGGAHSQSFKIGSPANLATSPKTPVRSAKKGGKSLVLTRADVNARDGFGRTLLHHAVSSPSESALDFVRVLLDIPLLDLYVQDTESGWTALHRALYCGNIAAAQALMLKDIQNATDYTTNVSHANAGGLVKIKDHEGNSPFEVFSLTTAPRDLRQDPALIEAAETMSVPSVDMDGAIGGAFLDLGPRQDLAGDEVFAFGSNKNITLGLGDGDDRTFPERIHLTRPEHLLQRLLEDHQRLRQGDTLNEMLAGSIADLQELPAIIQHKPVLIQDVVMSKLHTAILTGDPVSNLHICGFGPGGRLGTGDEAARFTFACIQGGGLAKRRMVSVALGQDHTVAVCSSGEVFTWGSNRYGQLGYELPEVAAHETPMQLVPRQIYGLIKKEQIIGAAASSLHSAIFTSSGLYTFGKNEGQLGLTDADARSLDIQIIPRRIGVSIIQHSIQSIEAIDRATIVLLENHEVIVFTHFGWTKVVFPLDSFGSTASSDAFFLRHNRPTKHICKVTSGGNTICALTTYGEVFTIDVPRSAEAIPNKSTTNPTKARNALPPPSQVWSIRKSHMAATDAAVGQDGSVILCTAAGTVWKKEKRAVIKTAHKGHAKAKEYKFVRVPNIFGALAVRSNSFGAFMAIRKDCDVMRDQILVEPPLLWENLFHLLAFRDYGTAMDDEKADDPQLRFWKPAIKGPCSALIRRALLNEANSEGALLSVSKRFDPLSASDYDVWVTSNVTEVRLPAHSFVLKARSKILRRALAEFSETYYFSISDVLAVEYGADGQIQLQLQGADFFTIVNFVLYLYTDSIADVWRFTSQALHLASRYRLVRLELMKIATALEMKQLERAVRVMDEPNRSLRDDFELAFHDSDLFSDADVVVDLADSEERYAHSVVLRNRCPFFEGLFGGHTGGMWMADRRQENEDGAQAIRVDLKHVTSNIFEIVLRHIYADTAEELFDAVVTSTLDEFIDLALEVMSVANELMLDRLARVCQKVIGRYVTPLNVCGLLNTVAESSEPAFNEAGLEYVGLNLENMLEQRLLEDLDEHLLEELDQVVQSNQLAFMPMARSDRVLQALFEQEPVLAEHIERDRQRRLDAMKLPSRYVVETIRPSAGSRAVSKGDLQAVPMQLTSPSSSPMMAPADDLPFEIDDLETAHPPGRRGPAFAPQPVAHQSFRPSFSRLSSSQRSQEMEDQSAHGRLSTPIVANSPRSPGTAATSLVSQLPWTTPQLNASGIGFRDIMLQDSSSGVSHLTQSLKQLATSPKQAPIKVSQKERKRQQHEQKVQAGKKAAAVEQTTPGAKKVEVGQSPWQKLAPKPQPTNLAPVPTSSSAGLSPKTPPPPKSFDVKGSANSGKPVQGARSISSPGMTGMSNAPPPQIQSIRHTPTPVRSSTYLDARTSMSEILTQQQDEKSAIKDLASKRTLQEIQQEQEFQEWWDLESRRVQEEEAAAAGVSSARTSNRGRGGKRKNVGTGDPRSSRQKPSKVDGGGASVERSQGEKARARGSYRARGRGAAVAS